jgi:LPS-assembly lipoprotein
VRTWLSLGLLTWLTGCGFQPLYGVHSASPGAPAEAKFAAVRVDTIPDRAGQQLRNELLDRLNPRGVPAQPLYHLTVQLAVRKQNLGIQANDTSTIGRVDVQAAFTLLDVGTEKPVHQGSSRSITTFQVVQSNFANIQAENDAQARALREISDDIRVQLALFFSKS